MLKKINRLSSLRIIGKAQKFETPMFNVRIFSGEESARFGFIVSKKIDKRAVIRNKTKRVLQKATENFLEDLKGKSIIILAKQKLIFKDLINVQKELARIFEKK
jgi:ribonuclease P protein component